jgi:alpha-amylase/alpha-mannosidase (GH57 family)
MPNPLTIHGHFYQPPRENPWTDVIDDQPSAAPLPNWNERVYAECYRPNAFARVLDSQGHIQRIVNNYAFISFNIGPTLLSWMEKAHPFTYRKILEADVESAQRQNGHGNAIAQAYNHAILPLCNKRDRLTQIRWGVADFKKRFGRNPESLWLSETAANDAVMDDLIDEGLRYVILSPFQAERVKSPNGAWQSVGDGSVDSGRAYRCLHSDQSGRSIAVFFYDPRIAKAIAFEGALFSRSTRPPTGNLTATTPNSVIEALPTLWIPWLPPRDFISPITALFSSRIRLNGSRKSNWGRMGKEPLGVAPTASADGSAIAVATRVDYLVGRKTGVVLCGRLSIFCGTGFSSCLKPSAESFLRILGPFATTTFN